MIRRILEFFLDLLISPWVFEGFWILLKFWLLFRFFIALLPSGNFTCIILRKCWKGNISCQNLWYISFWQIPKDVIISWAVMPQISNTILIRISLQFWRENRWGFVLLKKASTAGVFWIWGKNLRQTTSKLKLNAYKVSTFSNFLTFLC